MAGGYLPLRAPVVVWPYTPCSPALRDRCGRGGIGRRAGFRSRSPLGVEVRILSPAPIRGLPADLGTYPTTNQAMASGTVMALVRLISKELPDTSGTTPSTPRAMPPCDSACTPVPESEVPYTPTPEVESPETP